MKFETELKPLTSFSFSSLTDIVLLLLIFFLLTSQFVVNNGIPLKLPETKNSVKTEPSQIKITIDANGKVYYKGKTVSYDELAEALSLVPDKEKSNLIIQADKSTELEYVVRVIDLARETGIEKFTVETEKVR